MTIDLENSVFVTVFGAAVCNALLPGNSLSRSNGRCVDEYQPVQLSGRTVLGVGIIEDA